MDNSLLQEFRNLILNGYYNAEYAHKEIFSKERANVIIGHISIANSYINSAKAVYICNETLSRQEFDDFFHEFSSFSNEVMECIRTDHSHQWSDIHFERFNDKYQEVSELLGVVR